MTLAEISQYIVFDYLVAYEPFVYKLSIRQDTVASFWTDTFLVSEDTTDERFYINAFVSDIINYFVSTDSLDACVDNEKSFYWDDENQVLYAHVDHDEAWYTSDFSYGKLRGYSDNDVLYVDDIEYLPLVTSAPSVEQSADIKNYNKLAFITGAINMNNTEGLLDWIIDANLYGQIVNLKYVDDADIVEGAISRSDLVSIASLYVEDYDIGIGKSGTSVRIQDQRKAQNVDIPVDYFTLDDYENIEDEYINKPIPLVYGSVAEVPAIPVTGDLAGDVTFKVADTLTAIGQIQLFYDDIWNDVTAESTDLDNGEFVLDYSDCRAGGLVTGKIYKCRVESCTGEAITYASDVIKKLNELALNIEYNDTNYDTDEWESEETSLSAIGVFFSKKTKLYEAIRQIQAGSNVGFRYEINADGERTIRIDNEDRNHVAQVMPEDIANIGNLSVETDSSLIAAIVSVNYKRNYTEGTYRNEIDDSKKQEVVETYRQKPTMTIDTFLQTEALAAERASWEVGRFSTIPHTVEVQVIGKDLLTLRIYDIIRVAITKGFIDLDEEEITGREFYGVYDAQVLAVNPDMQKLVNNITVKLTEKIF